MRNDPSIVADSSAFFSGDRVGICSVLSVGFGLPRAVAIVRAPMNTGSLTLTTVAPRALVPCPAQWR